MRHPVERLFYLPFYFPFYYNLIIIYLRKCLEIHCVDLKNIIYQKGLFLLLLIVIYLRSLEIKCLEIHLVEKWSMNSQQSVNSGL